MKKLLLCICITVLTFSINAQVKTPAASPFAKVEQKVGLTDVTLEYSRPSMKGRTIFGDLLPYNKLWRTGANKNTTITFSDDVVIEGNELKAGSYAIFVKPTAESWKVIFYADTENWGTPREWDESKVAARVNTKVETLPLKVETFTITFDNLTNNSAVIGFIWDNTFAGVKFEVPTDKTVSANIESVMNGPAASDYYSAAVYYLQADKDISQAQKWIDKAIEMTSEKPRFWYLRQQSLIHAKAGNKKGAIEAAKKSLKHAKEAENDDYIKMNTESLKEWGAM